LGKGKKRKAGDTTLETPQRTQKKKKASDGSPEKADNNKEDTQPEQLKDPQPNQEQLKNPPPSQEPPSQEVEPPAPSLEESKTAEAPQEVGPPAASLLERKTAETDETSQEIEPPVASLEESKTAEAPQEVGPPAASLEESKTAEAVLNILVYSSLTMKKLVCYYCFWL
jgi:hypothetical protein